MPTEVESDGYLLSEKPAIYKAEAPQAGAVAGDKIFGSSKRKRDIPANKTGVILCTCWKRKSGQEDSNEFDIDSPTLNPTERVQQLSRTI